MIVVVIIVLSLVNFLLWSDIFYKQFFKRLYDIVLSGLAIILLSPVLLILTIFGAIKMRGNPFFTQERPGKDEKIFRLIKFRSMTCEKDEKGNYLPDEKRLTRYGKTLRATSLDELPELFNILKGDMSIVGPRPLLVKYLPYYSEDERKRHNVRPGLTGFAQVQGRNDVSWEQRFKMDNYYVDHVSIQIDLYVICRTIMTVLSHSGVELNVIEDLDDYRKRISNPNT